MYKKDLINALKDFPENYPIWIGAETGEGWTYGKTDEIFICNSTDAPLDGDGLSAWESEYFDSKDQIPKEKSGKEFIKIENEDGSIDVSGPIIVIGIKGSKQEVDGQKWNRLNKKELAKQTLLRTKEAYESNLRIVEKQLKELE